MCCQAVSKMIYALPHLNLMIPDETGTITFLILKKRNWGLGKLTLLHKIIQLVCYQAGILITKLKCLTAMFYHWKREEIMYFRKVTTATYKKVTMKACFLLLGLLSRGGLPHFRTFANSIASNWYSDDNTHWMMRGQPCYSTTPPPPPLLTQNAECPQETLGMPFYSHYLSSSSPSQPKNWDFS